jgi:hypothetical protein
MEQAHEADSRRAWSVVRGLVFLTSGLAAVFLAGSAAEAISRPSALIAWVVPLAVALAGLVAGLRFESRRWRAVVFGLYLAQVFAFSVGPVAYRLLCGPFLTVKITAPWSAGMGVDARFTLLLGAGNRMPEGLSVNLVALAAVILLEWQGSRLGRRQWIGHR